MHAAARCCTAPALPEPALPEPARPMHRPCLLLLQVSEFEACQAMAQRGLAMDPLITQDGDLFTLTLGGLPLSYVGSGRHAAPRSTGEQQARIAGRALQDQPLCGSPRSCWPQQLDRQELPPVAATRHPSPPCLLSRVPRSAMQPAHERMAAVSPSTASRAAAPCAATICPPSCAPASASPPRPAASRCSASATVTAAAAPPPPSWWPPASARGTLVSGGGGAQGPGAGRCYAGCRAEAAVTGCGSSLPSHCFLSIIIPAPFADLPEHFRSTAEQRMSQRLAALERQMASSAAAGVRGSRRGQPAGVLAPADHPLT